MHPIFYYYFYHCSIRFFPVCVGFSFDSGRHSRSHAIKLLIQHRCIPNPHSTPVATSCSQWGESVSHVTRFSPFLPWDQIRHKSLPIAQGGGLLPCALLSLLLSHARSVYSAR